MQARSLSLQPFPPPGTRDPDPSVPRSFQVFTSPVPALSGGSVCQGPVFLRSDSGVPCVSKACVSGAGTLGHLWSKAGKGEGRGRGLLLPGGCCGHALPYPSVTDSLLPASVGSLGSSSRATSRLGPQYLLLVPGASQEVGGEGQEAMTAVGSLVMGLYVTVPEL